MLMRMAAVQLNGEKVNRYDAILNEWSAVRPFAAETSLLAGSMSVMAIFRQLGTEAQQLLR
jgi:hypothetical protein